MKKLIVLAGILSLAAGLAEARVTPITDWSDSMNERVNIPNKDATACAEACPGYDLTITYCYTLGDVLENCEVEGCSYFHRCVSNQTQQPQQ